MAFAESTTSTTINNNLNNEALLRREQKKLTSINQMEVTTQGEAAKCWYKNTRAT